MAAAVAAAPLLGDLLPSASPIKYSLFRALCRAKNRGNADRLTVVTVSTTPRVILSLYLLGGFGPRDVTGAAAILEQQASRFMYVITSHAMLEGMMRGVEAVECTLECIALHQLREENRANALLPGDAHGDTDSKAQEEEEAEAAAAFDRRVEYVKRQVLGGHSDKNHAAVGALFCSSVRFGHPKRFHRNPCRAAVYQQVLRLMERWGTLLAPHGNGMISSSFSALMVACRRGCVTLMDCLLRQGLLPYGTVDRLGRTHLMLAVLSGNPAAVEMLLGIDGVRTEIDAAEFVDRRLRRHEVTEPEKIKHRGRSALLMAAQAGKYRMVDRLLECGADLLRRDLCDQSVGFTLLAACLERGAWKDGWRVLTQAASRLGAEVGAREARRWLEERDAYGATLFLLAAMHGQFDVVKLMCVGDTGPPTAAAAAPPSRNWASDIFPLPPSSTGPTAVTTLGHNALHLAFSQLTPWYHLGFMRRVTQRFRSPATVTYLIQRGYGVNTPQCGRTSLGWMLHSPSFESILSGIVLPAFGMSPSHAVYPDPRFDLNVAVDAKGKTTLFCELQGFVPLTGYPQYGADVIERLLRCGRSDADQQRLSEAMRSVNMTPTVRDIKLFQLIPPIDLQHRDHEGRTALFFARTEVIMRMLLALGMDPMALDRNERTPVQAALEAGDAATVTLLNNCMQAMAALERDAFAKGKNQ